MRLALLASGSRGDVQPMIAVGVALAEAGHDVVLCSSSDNAAWASRLGIPFGAIGEPLRDNPSLSAWGFRDFDPFIRRQIGIQARDLPRLVMDRDLLIATGLAFGAQAVAEHVRIPYRYISFVPASFLGTTHDRLRTRIVRGAADLYANLRYGAALDQARATLGLPRSRGVMRQLMGDGTIAATDPALTIIPQGARLRAVQTGYPLLRQQPGDLSEQLRLFLDAGPPPLYAGFGSMPIGNPARVVRLVVEAARRTGQRIVISRGWAGLSDRSDGSCLFIDHEPHDRLFPRVRAVIHHGGAGTVATAARAGVPQIVLPQAADQFLWRDAVAGLGLGPRAPSLRLARVASLAGAIDAAVTDEDYRRRATAMAARLADAPDGAATTADEITTPTSAHG